MRWAGPRLLFPGGDLRGHTETQAGGGGGAGRDGSAEGTTPRKRSPEELPQWNEAHERGPLCLVGREWAPEWEGPASRAPDQLAGPPKAMIDFDWAMSAGRARPARQMALAVA